MALDNVTFLIMWFMVMFITLSSGILVIMYRVGCFKCDQKIGIAELQTSLEKLMRPQSEQDAAQAQAHAAAVAVAAAQNAAEQGAAGAAAATGVSVDAAAAAMSITPRGRSGGGDLHTHTERTTGPESTFQLQRQSTDRSEGRSGSGNSGPTKICTVCNEPLGPDEDPSENSHPSCRDMDASFF